MCAAAGRCIRQLGVADKVYFAMIYMNLKQINKTSSLGYRGANERVAVCLIV
jgi:hypothetical protein